MNKVDAQFEQWSLHYPMQLLLGGYIMQTDQTDLQLATCMARLRVHIHVIIRFNLYFYLLSFLHMVRHFVHPRNGLSCTRDVEGDTHCCRSLHHSHRLG